MEICRDMACLLMFLINLSLAEVILRLPTEIELGKPLTFNCEILNVIPATKSRQWRGGDYNKLLCFDGISIDPTKYTERIINQTNYDLIVKNTSESDLQCPYACHVGFDSDQKILEVNENNFLQLPNGNFNKIDYQMQNGNYSLKFILRKVFPIPVCMLKMKEANIYLPVVNVQSSRVLLDVTYYLALSDAISACEEILEVDCHSGRTGFQVPFQNSATCNPLTIIEESRTSVIFTCIVGLCIVVGLVVLLVILKRRSDTRHNVEKIKNFDKDDSIEMTSMIL